MGSVVHGWGKTVQMKVIYTQAVDFEAVDDVLSIKTIYMQLTPMKSEDVSRKPEGLRIYKWFHGITTAKVGKDTVLQGPDGIEYRVDDMNDWSDSGFTECDIVQQPKGTQ
jgi:IS30 family transposase